MKVRAAEVETAAAEAADMIHTVLQQMGTVLAPLVAKVYCRRRRFRLRAWFHYQWHAARRIRQRGLCSAAEVGCNRGNLWNCLVMEQWADGIQHRDLVHQDVRAPRPTEASSVSENLNKRPKN